MKFAPSTCYLTTHTDTALSAVMLWAAETTVHCVRSNKTLQEVRHR
jgi:hypothetical protein